MATPAPRLTVGWSLPAAAAACAAAAFEESDARAAALWTLAAVLVGVWIAVTVLEHVRRRDDDGEP